jgi:signal-transduction protein with cAMP-binding, CBS, and nucleotidyltransferase domain
VLSAVDYLRNLSRETKEELHYKMILENFEHGAKIITEGNSCKEIKFVIGGQLELYVEEGKNIHVLDVLDPGSCVGAYSVLNGARMQFSGRALGNV